MTSMTVSTGSSKKDPGEDLPLFTPLLRKLHLSQLQLAEAHFIANSFLHVPALKTQDPQIDDIEITVLKKRKKKPARKATMAMHRLSTNLIICLHWPSLKPLADIRLLLQLLIPRTQIHLNMHY